MKCQITGCENDGIQEIAIRVTDTPFMRILMPMTAKVCNDHLAMVLKGTIERLVSPTDPELGGEMTPGFFCDDCQHWFPMRRHECLAKLRA